MLDRSQYLSAHTAAVRRKLAPPKPAAPHPFDDLNPAALLLVLPVSVVCGLHYRAQIIVGSSAPGIMLMALLMLEWRGPRRGQVTGKSLVGFVAGLLIYFAIDSITGHAQTGLKIQIAVVALIMAAVQLRPARRPRTARGWRMYAAFQLAFWGPMLALGLSARG